MQEKETKCIRCVGETKLCSACNSSCIKWGKTLSGTQRYHCNSCNKTMVASYIYKAHRPGINRMIVSYLKEGCGILSTSRLLEISPTTVQNRILQIARQISKPHVFLNKSYEMDEILTYIGKKTNTTWIAYALSKDNKCVVDFRVGKRTNKTLKPVVETLQLSEARKICTDKLKNYTYLIDKKIHNTLNYGTNYIERHNLTLRTHLKRLSRRTICFSKSLQMLAACLTIYFWG